MKPNSMEGNGIQTVSIMISGVVQGVGFRPFVAGLAAFLGIRGTVLNAGGSVEISAEAPPGILKIFMEDIRAQAPINSHIAEMTVETMPYQGFADFRILRSIPVGRAQMSFIPPDVSICDDCVRELRDHGNRRYRHPFISCASCGPRYSIADRLPYDRCSTSMQDFEMCPACSGEYTGADDRRYHAQTLSCHECGPQLLFKGTVDLAGEDALNEAARTIRHGGMIAVKGIGGYHLACSPYNLEAVARIRSFKKREEKPFAVMFPDMDSLEACCTVDGQERNLLLSAARPIVLLIRKESGICPEVYKDSRYLGAFLPYTPLHFLLTEACGPLVMTSANLSGSPIIADDEEMLRQGTSLLDGVLYHRRKIRTGIDDSVALSMDGNILVSRYSRGYAPLPVRLGKPSAIPLLAAGGDLKSSFCLLQDQNAYISQFFGDLENERSYTTYTEGIRHLKRILRISPQAVVCDSHPGYFSHTYADGTGLPVLQVQHHFAHIASVMAEHALTEPVIGVAFDGTGYGEDGAVWGGEFLLCTPAGFERRGHLEYTVLCGGDAISSDSRLCAYAHLHAAGLDTFFKDERSAVIRSAIDHKVNTIRSSSMGRLFDSVSAILGLSDTNRYEGQSAIILENSAYYAMTGGLKPYPLEFRIADYGGILTAGQIPLVQRIAEGISRGIPAGELALGFHEAAAKMVLEMCCRIRSSEKVSQVALSGGVFQNIVLFRRCLELLRKNGFVVYYNQRVPSNDGGIALGQAYIGSALLG